MKVYQAIARAIVDEGVTIAFVLMGEANLEVIATLQELGFANFHQCRHESAVIAEGEGYSKASGRTAFCAVTSGSGLANGFLSLTEAVRAGAPLVVFTGQSSRDDRVSHQNLDHQALAKLAGAHYESAGSPDGVLHAVRSAFHHAKAHRTAVVLDIDIDLQGRDLAWEYEYEPSGNASVTLKPIAPDADLIMEAGQRLARSQRPIFIAGSGASTPEAAGAIERLAHESGALLSTTLPVRGMFADNPMNIGIAGMFSTPLAGQLFAESDCIVAFGASLNHYTTEGGFLFPEAEVIQFDTSGNVTMANLQRADLYILGDAGLAAEALRDAYCAVDSTEHKWHPKVAEMITDQVVDASTVRIDPGLVDPREVVVDLERALPPQAGLVTGTGHFWSFANMHMTRRYTPQLFTYFFGAVGQGLSIAVGAAAAFPTLPMVLIEGDGSLLMNVSELEVVASHKPHLLVVVMNDQAFGAEFHKLRSKGFEPDMGMNPATDIAAIASSFGCRSAIVDGPGILAGLVEEFLSSDGPMVVDCRISRNVVSAPYRRLYFGSE